MVYRPPTWKGLLDEAEAGKVIKGGKGGRKRDRAQAGVEPSDDDMGILRRGSRARSK